MERTTAFGYEQENGNIFYSLSHNLILDDIEKYLISRITPSELNINIKSDSIIDYFSHEKYEEDNSNWRILYMLDGTIKCRRKFSGEFIYKSKLL
jgi:hypothetical protein